MGNFWLWTLRGRLPKCCCSCGTPVRIGTGDGGSVWTLPSSHSNKAGVDRPRGCQTGGPFLVSGRITSVSKMPSSGEGVRQLRRRSPLRRFSAHRMSPLRRASPSRRSPSRLSSLTSSVEDRRIQIRRPGPARACRRPAAPPFGVHPDGNRLSFYLLPDDVPRPTYGRVWCPRSISETTFRDHLTYTPPLEACEGQSWAGGRRMRPTTRCALLVQSFSDRPYRRGLRLRAGPVARALAVPRDAPPEDARERGVVARGVLARGVLVRGAADRVGGARRAAAARGGVRVGAVRADGWVALLRLGEAVIACDPPEARAPTLGVYRVAGARSLIDIERVTAPERDGALARDAALEGAEASERRVVAREGG